MSAVRLAVERALALVDAGAFPFDVESARRRLRRAARGARASHPLSAGQADYVRSLTAVRPRPAVDISAGLVIELPDRLLIRARSELAETALRGSAVPEMVAWEVAATLEGRTMGEWALRVLTRSLTA